MIYIEFLEEGHLYWGFTHTHLPPFLSFTSHLFHFHNSPCSLWSHLHCSHWCFSITLNLLCVSLSYFFHSALMSCTSHTFTSCSEGLGWVKGGLGSWLMHRSYFWRGEGRRGAGREMARRRETVIHTCTILEWLVRIMFAAGVRAAGWGALLRDRRTSRFHTGV